MTQLVKYEAACQAIAECATVDEAKDIHDKAAAMQAYGRQAKNRSLEVQAAKIRFRAERRLGELLEDTERAPAGRPSQEIGSESEPIKPPTLKEMGIDKKLSSRAQKLAAIPEEQFEGMISDWQERVSKETERVTTNLLREGEKAQRDADLAKVELSWPEGKFQVIYADPPWRYENPPMGGSNRSIENHYPTMNLVEICALDIGLVADDNCVLFLWATAPKLSECMEVITAWGFTYRTCMVWIKDKIGMGYHARNQHEILLIAKRGEMAPPEPSDRPSSVLQAPRLEHSAKPLEYYDIIERMYPKQNKLELFCRSPRDGWAVWGNQAAAE